MKFSRSLNQNENRKTEVIAGFFYILATVAPISTYPFIGFLFSELPQNILSQVSANQVYVIIGGLIELLYALAVIGIIVTLYPILKKQRPVLSLGFFSLRFLEAIAVMMHSVLLFCLVSLSSKSSGLSAVDLELIGELIIEAREWIFLMGSGIIWSLSAVVLNTLLYQARLLPRWISVWGLIGSGLSFFAYGFQFFGIVFPEIAYLPIGIQEMVFAGWLITKGLDTEAKIGSV